MNRPRSRSRRPNVSDGGCGPGRRESDKRSERLCRLRRSKPLLRRKRPTRLRASFPRPVGRQSGGSEARGPAPAPPRSDRRRGRMARTGCWGHSRRCRRCDCSPRLPKSTRLPTREANGAWIVPFLAANEQVRPPNRSARRGSLGRRCGAGVCWKNRKYHRLRKARPFTDSWELGKSRKNLYGRVKWEKGKTCTIARFAR
jgi:hypothetical protein